MGQFSEKKWPVVPPLALTANGGVDGSVQVSDTSNFYVGQIVHLISSSVGSTQYKVRQVFSSTLLYVSKPESAYSLRADMSSFTTADSALISADQQPRPAIVSDEIIRATYANEPAVAVRSLLVDKLGNKIDSVVGVDGRNRLAVDAAVSVTGISVDLDALTPPNQADPDNVLIAGSQNGTKGGTKGAIRINTDNRMEVVAIPAGINIPFDAIALFEPDAVTEEYSYFTGGLAGTLVRTVTIIYTSAAKTTLVSTVYT